MPIIRPDGLLRGERIARLSDTAKFYWPWLYAASNGYGRFEIDYLLVLESAFSAFEHKPSEEELMAVLQEYKKADLLFIYEAEGSVWGAWDSNSGQKWFNKTDKASPDPPEPAFAEWKESYRAKKNCVPRPRKGSLGRSLLINDENTDFQQRKEPVSTPNSLTQHSTNTTSTQHSISGVGGVEEEGLEDKLPTLAVSRLGVEGWDELIEAAAKAQMSMDPDPGGELCQKYWKRLDFEGRRRRIQGIWERIKCGQYDDPQYVHTLENYVKRAWRESMRPRGQPGPHLVADTQKPAERMGISRSAAQIREAC